MVPSKYQTAIYDCIDNSRSSILVSAVAGSGKTTMLLEIMNRIPITKSVRFLAFNSSIAKEISSRVPCNAVNVSVSTVHSYGLSAIRNSRKNVEVDGSKYSKIFDDMFEPNPNDRENTMSDRKRRVMPMIDLLRINMVDNWEEAFLIADKYDIPADETDCKLAIDAINRGAKRLSTVDFVDMIYLPIRLGLERDKFDVVLIDEAQDLSEAQRILAVGAVARGGRFVAVGDPYQSIYGFAGADIESFNKFRSMKGVEEKPLSVCYRCGKKIIDMAKSIVSHIEAADTAIDGIVEVSASMNDVVGGDMVLCRNTAPLVRLCFAYLSAGKKANIMGRDIGESMIAMIKRTKASTFDCLYSGMAKELDRAISDVVNTRRIPIGEATTHPQVAAIADRIDAIRSISEGCKSVNEVILKIGAIFRDESDGIVLSTIHKSKGLEADNVYILSRELMPSKHAKTAWAKVQENNLIYVAYTRAKKKLGFISDYKSYGDVNIAPACSVVSSGFIGSIGDEAAITAEIVDVIRIETKFGITRKYIMSSDGCMISKIGSMAGCKIDRGGSLSAGSVVKFRGVISEHSERGGIKETRIGRILND